MDADSQKKIDKMIAAMYREQDHRAQVRAKVSRWEAGEVDVFDEPPTPAPEPPSKRLPARWLVPEDKPVKCKFCGAEMDEHKLRPHWKERHWYAYRALQGRLNNAQRQREQEFRISSRPQEETWVDMSGLGRIER